MVEFLPTPQMVEFIPLKWVELATWHTLIVFSRPVDARYLHPMNRWDD